MSGQGHLSVIIPTLNRVGTARLLGARVRALLPSLTVEVIVVTPFIPEGDDAGTDIRYVEDQRRGVYAAYTRGLRASTGEYVWFMGDDDYPLDGVRSLREWLEAASADVLVAPVLFSNGRMYRQRRTLLLLQFLNWCQQGVIYRRRLFERYRFFRRFTVQADQYVNVRLRSDPNVKIVFTGEPICVFGIEGISGQKLDTRYRSARVALARRTLGTAGFTLFRLLTMIEPLAKRLLAVPLAGRRHPQSFRRRTR